MEEKRFNFYPRPQDLVWCSDASLTMRFTRIENLLNAVHQAYLELSIIGTQVLSWLRRLGRENPWKTSKTWSGQALFFGARIFWHSCHTWSCKGPAAHPDKKIRRNDDVYQQHQRPLSGFYCFHLCFQAKTTCKLHFCHIHKLFPTHPPTWTTWRDSLMCWLQSSQSIPLSWTAMHNPKANKTNKNNIATSIIDSHFFHLCLDTWMHILCCTTQWGLSGTKNTKRQPVFQIAI